MKLSPEKRTEIVNDLVVNSCGCWKAGDEKLLSTFSDEKLTELQASANQAKLLETAINQEHTIAGKKVKWDSVAKKFLAVNADPSEESDAPSEDTPAGGGSGDDTPAGGETTEGAANAKKLSPKEWWDSAPPEYKAFHNMAKKVVGRERGRLIEQLTVNCSAAVKPAKVAELNKRSTEDLELMASLLPVPAVNSRQHATEDDFEPNFFASVGGRSSGGSRPKIEALVPYQEMDWEEMANSKSKTSRQ